MVTTFRAAEVRLFDRMAESQMWHPHPSLFWKAVQKLEQQLRQEPAVEALLHLAAAEQRMDTFFRGMAGPKFEPPSFLSGELYSCLRSRKDFNQFCRQQRKRILKRLAREEGL
jgi:hypothetical protein